MLLAEIHGVLRIPDGGMLFQKPGQHMVRSSPVTQPHIGPEQFHAQPGRGAFIAQQVFPPAAPVNDAAFPVTSQGNRTGPGNEDHSRGIEHAD